MQPISKILATTVAAFTLFVASPQLSTSPATAATAAQQAKMKVMNRLTGRTFEYEVAGHKVRTEFLAEDKMRWTHLEAPVGQDGRTGEESVDRRDVHYGIVLLSWTEKNGTSVFDVLDLQTMTIHANAILANGKRIFTKVSIREVK